MATGDGDILPAACPAGTALDRLRGIKVGANGEGGVGTLADGVCSGSVVREVEYGD